MPKVVKTSPRRAIWWSLTLDASMVAGLASVLYGAWLLGRPALCIVGGLLVFALALALDLKGNRG